MDFDTTRIPLTIDEVQELPDGTPIIVVWSGGNGPWPYTLRRDTTGPVAGLDTDRAGYYDHIGRGLGPSDFIGQERYHTQVRLNVKKVERPAPTRIVREGENSEPT